MTTPIFLYGTLRDPALFAIVGGAALAGRPATLADHATAWAEDEAFPLIFEQPGGQAEGMLVEAGDAVRERLDFYELGFHYTLRPVRAVSDGAEVDALVYFPDDGIWRRGAPWSLADWQRRFGEHAREAAEEYMRLFGRLTPEAAAAAFPQIRMRAFSRLRARTAPTPQAFRPEMTADAVQVARSEQPYTRYFAVREEDLSFPTFSGGRSDTINRASFMGGDAVTVLPYDPASDSVLVIRQFRHGPFVRGDGNPWSLEPAAGRIDPDETAEDTALRELREETGVTAERLFKVADYYPSPGAYSEFLTSFVALADLSGYDGRTDGLAEEHEDIMSHVIPFEQLMELIESGAANTAPLVISALWLALRRDSLRGAH